MRGGIDKPADVGEQPIADGVGKVVGLDQTEAGVCLHLDLGEQLVADPPHPQPVYAEFAFDLPDSTFGIGDDGCTALSVV